MAGTDPGAHAVPPPPPASALLGNLTVFVDALRRAGLPVATDQTLTLARALAWIDLGNRRQVFHTARALLVTRRGDLALFAALFDRFFQPPQTPAGRGRRAPRAPRHDDPAKKPFTVVDYLAFKARRRDPALEVVDRTGTYSDREVLRHKDFSTLTPEELARVKRLIARLRWAAGVRVTRRRVADRRGDAIDLRRALRATARRGAVPADLPRRRRKVKRRPLVLLADVSGSMEKYARLVLQLFFCMAYRRADVESFVFGTRLSRLTAELRPRNIDRAIDQAARAVDDWAGGTRIGDSLRTFNRVWGKRVLRRGAVVVVVSDGWERGDSALLRREMRHLQRRCHRLIWLNPLAGRDGYRPLVEGMAAALPQIDDFLPVHNLHSLEQLAARLATLPRRRSAPVCRPRTGHPPPATTRSMP